MSESLRTTVMKAYLLSLGLVGSPRSYAFEIGYGGRLSTPSGAPVEGSVHLVFRFYAAATGGSPLLELPASNIPLVDGMFHVALTLTDSQVQSALGDGSSPLFIETMYGDQTYPRQKFSFVPFALRVPIDEDKLRYVEGRLTLNPNLVLGSGGVTSVNLSAPPTGLSVSGGPITSSGSISINLANDLAAVESLNTTGGVERTGPDTWGTFTLTPAGKTLLAGADAAAQRTALGLGSLATRSSLNTSDVAEGSGQYFTTPRARQSLNATGPVTYNRVEFCFE